LRLQKSGDGAEDSVDLARLRQPVTTAFENHKLDIG